MDFLRAGIACLTPGNAGKTGLSEAKTSEGTLHQKTEIFFSEINCKQIVNERGKKCGGPAGHKIGEENREFSGKLNDPRPTGTGISFLILENHGKNTP